MDAGKYPQVTLISAAARERMNQLDVTCNLLLFVMMKITQLFPTRLKKVKNKPSIQYQTNSILYCLWVRIWVYNKICCRLGVEIEQEMLNYRVFRMQLGSEQFWNTHNSVCRTPESLKILLTCFISITHTKKSILQQPTALWQPLWQKNKWGHRWRKFAK